MARILVIDDDAALRRTLRMSLEVLGHRTVEARDGVQAVESLAQQSFQAALLDLRLGQEQGLDVLPRLLAIAPGLPVIIVTAFAAIETAVEAMRRGAFDYLPKPFQLRELLLRVAAILRRRMRYDAMTALEPVVRFGGNAFDFRSFRGRSWDGADQVLTQKEAMILKVLVEREGQVVWRDEIIEQVWGDDVMPSSRTVDNFIVRLRKRFEPDTEKPRHFHTVRGVGYRFTASPEGAA